MKKLMFLLLFIVCICWNITLAQQAEPTEVVVRAKAKDAKFIGSSMGGVVVAIRDSRTGRLMAQGKIKGSTGNTDFLMRTPIKRDMKLSKGGAAKFDTTLMLEQPVLATIEAKGPMAQLQSSVITSKQVWLIPGKDLDEDGIILEFPGFSVDLMSPRAHQLIENGDKVEIKANVVMMCGCPTRPGGLWNSDVYDIEAWILKEGTIVKKFPVEYSGQTSLYTGTFQPRIPGTYEIMLVAYDKHSKNTGVDKTTFIYAK